MKISTIYLLLACAACGRHASASMVDSFLGDDVQHADNKGPHRHLKSVEDRKYYATETNMDKDAVIVPLSKLSRSRIRSGRIAYGDKVSDGQFPTVIWLRLGDSICTGTLIAPKAVLTAGHCVRDDNGDWIDMSDVEVNYGSEYYDYTDAYTIDLMVSPKYDGETLYGDLALLRLKERIDADFIPLASSSTRLTPQVDVVGRGEMEDGKFPDVMMYTQVSTMTEEECNDYHDQIIGDLPPKGMLCFGLDSNPSTQSCGGDSGGPYFTTGNNPVQVGIVSYGPDIECGSIDDNLEVATSVAYWNKWINRNLSKYKMK